MFQPCFYGGNCIDSGNPSDCEVNNRCVNFDSAEKKANFDNLPDLFIVKGQGIEIKFKNKSQLKFFLTDYKGDWKVKVIINELEIPVDLIELFK